MASAKISKRTLSPIYPRMLGYTVTLVMHITNAIITTNTFRGEILKDPDVRQFHENQLKFLTIWNVYMQSFYAALGLSCDVLSLTNEGKDSALVRTLKRIRDPMFSCLVCPFSFTVSTVFWAAFSYDRTLILPPSVDSTLGWNSNHVIHTAIVPVAVWELVFRPRKAPESHVLNLLLMNSYAAVYLVVIVTSYLTAGTWIYPILNLLNGTIYLYLFFAIAVILTQTFYFLQWHITGIFWKRETKKVD